MPTPIKITIEGDESVVSSFFYQNKSESLTVKSPQLNQNLVKKPHPITLISLGIIGAIAAILNIPEASHLWDKVVLSSFSSIKPKPKISTVNGEAIARAALKRVGNHFKPGQIAQCAFFVRDVLTELGIDLPLTRQPFDKIRESAKGVAASMAGSDIGTLIYNTKDLKPGDLVFFADTYGNWPSGTITHVGIYIGNGKMVDRGTHTAPVKYRSISIFKFAVGVRIHPKYFPSVSNSEKNLDLHPIQAREKIGNLQVGDRVYFPCKRKDKSDCTTHPITKEKNTKHPAIDIAAPRGFPQKAVGNVRVTCHIEMVDGEIGGAGYWLIMHLLDRPNLRFRSFHLLPGSCIPGEHKFGDIVGLTGSTGSSTRDHIHWEQQVLIDGVWVNIHPQYAYLNFLITGRL